MAEFHKVMRQWSRICMEYVGDGNCKDCPLVSNDVCGEIYGATDEDIRRALATITAWAAEHPEPVYPTWGEWFVEHGDLVDGWQNATNAAWMANTALGVFMNPIPAEIAQKLGIEPKEGV